ncbi:hypothetical protein TWF696_006575 [Orbilia brochopaga]|uniref:SAGA-associated factor 11 n=1 Tax=Orbilia brochopaga TaxID=3140254 RepID=A0AAV9UZX9_9PEZI
MSEGTTSEKVSMEDLVKGVFAGFMSMITEDIVLEAHRTEKLTNMGYFSQDGVPVTTEELQSKRNEEPELLSAMVMGRSLRIPVEDNICQKCQHPIQQSLDSSLTTPARKYCLKQPYRVINGQDMYGKTIASNTIQIPKQQFKPKVHAALASGSRQSTPTVGEDGGKLPPVKDPQGLRLPCPACGTDTSFKMWIPKHKSCLGYADKKVNSNNGDSGSGTPLSPDSPSSSFAEGETAPPKKKKSQAESKPAPKKLQVKKDSSTAGESVQKGSITSAPRLEKSLSTASTRADSPTPSSATNNQTAAPSSAGPKKKKQLLKRKAESLDEEGDKKASADPYDIDSHPGAAKEKDAVSITPTKPSKKQKTSNTPTSAADAVRVSPHPGTPTTKNLVSKFKDRQGSPTPLKKDKLGGVDMSRSQSDSSAMHRKPSPRPPGLGDKDSKPKKSKPDGSPTMKKLTAGGMTKVSKKDPSGKTVPHKKKEKRPTPDRA